MQPDDIQEHSVNLQKRWYHYDNNMALIMP